MTRFLTLAEAAQRLGVRPWDISGLLYQRRALDELCPVVSGRRLIPREYLPVIETALLDRQRRVSVAAPGPGGRPQEGPAVGCVEAGSSPACPKAASHITQAREEGST